MIKNYFFLDRKKGYLDKLMINFIILIFISFGLIAHDTRSECTPACNNRKAICIKTISKLNKKEKQIELQKCEEEFRLCNNHCNSMGPTLRSHN